MSLIPTYVYAEDGLFYKNPVIQGDNFFICFDDRDPPEIVIKYKPYSTNSLILVARSLLIQAGIKAQLINPLTPKTSQRVFDHKRMRFTEAFSFFFKLTAPIPPPPNYRGVKFPDASECSIEGISHEDYAKLRQTHGLRHTTKDYYITGEDRTSQDV